MQKLPRSVLPGPSELIGESADNRFEGAEDRAEREGDQHGEEEDGPHVRDLHHGHHLRVDDEGQPRATLYHLDKIIAALQFSYSLTAPDV